MIELLNNCITEKFLNAKHKHMWTFVDTVDDIIDAILNAQTWPEDAHKFAVVRD
jgi:hypothetical protein